MAANSPLVPDDIPSLPGEILDSLSNPSLANLFNQNQYYDQIRGSWTLKPAIDLIERYSHENGLVVYHCTKELFSGKFRSEGLRVLDHQRHVDEFLEYAEKTALLGASEREEIEPTLRTWRDKNHAQGRDGTLHFIPSRRDVCNLGVEKFFRYYGGEALYWPFGPWRPNADHWFLRLLESIGVPVVVEAKVDPSDLVTGSANFGADIVISHFAQFVNPGFEGFQPFCFTRKSVAPEQIISATPLDSIVKKFDLVLGWDWIPQCLIAQK